MKYFLLTFLTLFIAYSFGQNPTYKKIQFDSLIKYSYLTYAFQPQEDQSMMWENGTGFFVRTGTDTFFITARHVYNGCDSLYKDTTYPDYMSILLEGKMMASVDIRKIKDTAKCQLFTEKADVISVRTNYIGGNFFDRSSLSQTDVKDSGSIVLYGYPKGDFSNWIRSSTPKSIMMSDYKIYENLQVNSTIDTLNYWIVDSRIVIDETIKGCSGSPVFIIDRKTDSYNMMGVLVGIFVDKKNNRSGIVVCKLKNLISILPQPK